MYLKCGNPCHSLVCSVFEAPTVEGVPHSVRVSRNQGRVWYVFLLPAGIPHWPGVWTCIEWYKKQTVRASSWWWDQTPPFSNAHNWRHDLSAQSCSAMVSQGKHRGWGNENTKKRCEGSWHYDVHLWWQWKSGLRLSAHRVVPCLLLITQLISIL